MAPSIPSTPLTPRLSWAIVVLYLAAIAVLSVVEFASERSRERDRMYASMQAAGDALDQILGIDFHDRYTPSHPIPPADYARLVGELNRFARHMKIEYVYSMVQVGGKVHFVVSNETRDDSLRGTPSRFYNPYPEPPSELLQAFADDRRTQASYTNIWDSFCSIFIPRRSPGGLLYILAADIKYADYRTVLLRCLARSVVLVLVLLLPLLPLVHLQRERLKAHVEASARDKAHAVELARLNDQLEATVARRTAELEQALDDLRRFSYTVSHDLITPLNAISGYVQIVQEEMGRNLSPEQASHLEHVVAAAGRMRTMVKTMLYQATHRNAPLARERLDLSALAHEVVDELGAAGEGFGAEVEIAAGLVVHGDPSLIRLVLQNLFSNAFKYSRDTASARVVVEGGSGEGEDWFQVRDNGAGFDPGRAEHLFQPFERLHGDGFEGHGIGLSHVARLVERHGGTISALGKPGQGAAFRVVLPRGDLPPPGGARSEMS